MLLLRSVFEATSHQVLYMATKVAFTFGARSPGKSDDTDRAKQSKNPSLKLSGKNVVQKAHPIFVVSQFLRMHVHYFSSTWRRFKIA